MLIQGQWSKKWDPFQKNNEKGEFIRQTSSFRHWVTADGKAGPTGEPGFNAEPNRYHLYIALICPWASRTLMTLYLKGLENVISVSIVEPFLTDQGWQFTSSSKPYAGATIDHLNHYQFVHQLYTHAQKDISGRATVPLLWDKHQQTIVNNESADIINMLDNAFSPWEKHKITLRPKHLLNEINSLNHYIYKNINNAVYQAGFAKSQNAYQTATTHVFAALDKMNTRLQQSTYLLGEQLTESDVRLFVTLIRFDVAYYGLFKCNQYLISDFHALQNYMENIYRAPRVAQSVNIEHIKQGYYSVRAVNPQGIVPLGPKLSWLENAV